MLHACEALLQVDGAETAERWLGDYLGRKSLWNEFPLIDLRRKKAPAKADTATTGKSPR